MTTSPFLSWFLIAVAAASAAAQTVQPPYNGHYSAVNVGMPAGVPAPLGGLAFRNGEPGVLYVGGAANKATAAVYKVPVVRDAQNHITGFAGAGVKFADAPNLDGGLQFGPGGVLFFTRYPMNELGMIKPGSAAMDKSVALTGLGIPGSLGSLTFVPAGFPNAGRLKLASFTTSRVHTASLVADGNGTFDVTVAPGFAQIQGALEGCFYVAPDSPLFPNFTRMMFAEYNNGALTVYTIDANGDPIPATRQVFLSGLNGVEGAAIDPLTGDFLFSTFGANSRVIAVRGFATVCGTVARYGQGLSGSGGFVPRIDTLGCFARNQTPSFAVSQGRGGAPGVLLFGFQQAGLPLFGGTLLVTPFVVIDHVLAGTSGQPGAGTFQVEIAVPNDLNLLNTDFFFQAAYLDPGAPQGVSFTGGIRLDVR